MAGCTGVDTPNHAVLQSISWFASDLKKKTTALCHITQQGARHFQKEFDWKYKKHSLSLVNSTFGTMAGYYIHFEV